MKNIPLMNIDGLIIGLSTFVIIGVFHPIVIKAEYHLGVRCWPLFALVGTGAVIASIFVTNTVVSILLGVLGFSCFWSIIELFQQRKRVARGWFPKNPKRTKEPPTK